MKILREIKAIGWKNWWWFCIFLGRDEFSDKLNLYHYQKDMVVDYYKLSEDRKRAHEISNILEDLK